VARSLAELALGAYVANRIELSSTDDHIKHELNRENDVNAVMIAIELRRLVAVAIKPFSHCGHLTREIRRGKPNLHDPREFASQAIALGQNG
jgi:hypothetical protein